MKTVVIEGQLREGLGRKASRDLRSQGNVLGVIYGGKDQVHFSVDETAFKPILLSDVISTPLLFLSTIKI